MPLRRIKSGPRSAEEIGDEQSTRKQFRHRPSVETLTQNGEVDPEGIMTLAAEESLLKGLVELRRAREARGLSLSVIARKSGIDLASLSRLESGKNPNPTFETVSRYADALGLRLELSLIEIESPDRAR
jgi:DNA-binding phage protein